MTYNILDSANLEKVLSTHYGRPA